MPSCNVYYKNDYYYIVSTALINKSFEFSVTPMIKIYSKSTFEDIGKAILYALNSYKVIEKQPENFSLMTKAFYQFLNVKSQKDLDKTASLYSIIESQENLTIIPNAVHEDGGYTPMNEQKIKIEYNLTLLGKTIYELVYG